MLLRRVLALLAFAAAAALVLLSAAPVAADHVYSHRYVILGRVIDSLGDPALGWTASATFSGVTPAGLCTLPPTPVPDTTAQGDFFLCYHIHGLGPGESVTVSGPGYTSDPLPLDVNLRKSFVHVRLLTTWSQKDPAAVAGFHSNYTVRGRVWQSAPGTTLEGVPVNGVSLATEPVSIHISYNGGTQHTGPGLTNNYGDYTHVIPLVGRLTDGATDVSAHGMRTPPDGVDTDFMVSEADVVLPAPPNPLLEFLANYYWAVLIPIAAVAGGWYFLSRARPRRLSRDVSRIPGVGRAKAQKLRDSGTGTIDRLAAASPKELATATGLTTKETKRLVRKAKDFLSAERGEEVGDERESR